MCTSLVLTLNSQVVHTQKSLVLTLNSQVVHTQKCQIEVQTSLLNRLDRSGQSSQNAKWTSPLHRSRRDDQNAYVEHPI